jgi:hypothetical protein
MPTLGFACSDYAHVLFISHMGLWAQALRPAFPAPSLDQGDTLAALGRLASRECERLSLRGARDKIAKRFCAATKQSRIIK